MKEWKGVRGVNRCQTLIRLNGTKRGKTGVIVKGKKGKIDEMGQKCKGVKRVNVGKRVYRLERRKNLTELKVMYGMN